MGREEGRERRIGINGLLEGTTLPVGLDQTESIRGRRCTGQVTFDILLQTRQGTITHSSSQL